MVSPLHTRQHQQVETLLVKLTHELKKHQLWQDETPSAEALASQEPFALDTLTFHQWLQFIFIPRFLICIEQQQALPIGFSVAPMAAEVWKYEGQYQKMVRYIQQIDRLCE